MCFFSNFLGSEQKIQFDMSDVTRVELSSKVIYEALEFGVGEEVHVFVSFSTDKRMECYDLCKKMAPESLDDLTSSDEEKEENTDEENDEEENDDEKTCSDVKERTSSSPSRSASPPSHKGNDHNEEKLPDSWKEKFDSMKIVADVSLSLDLDAVFNLLLADNAKCSCVHLSKHSPNGGESNHKLTAWKVIEDDDSNERNEDNTKSRWFESSTRYSHNRKFEFRKKLNHAIGPSETTVYQDHRYGFFDMDGELCLAFESIVTTPNVPYGTYFLVRLKYLLVSESKSATRLKVAVCVDMLKSTMWSGTCTISLSETL